jgi:hypothetical protein
VAEEIFNNKIIVEKTNGISELNITKEWYGYWQRNFITNRS